MPSGGVHMHTIAASRRHLGGIWDASERHLSAYAHSQVFVGLGVLAVADHLEALGGIGSRPEIFAEIGGWLPQVVTRVARRMGAEIWHGT